MVGNFSIRHDSNDEVPDVETQNAILRKLCDEDEEVRAEGEEEWEQFKDEHKIKDKPLE